jgi:hypothetical protein
MPNDYYTPSGNPQTLNRGSSAVIRAEFVALQNSFNLLPSLDQAFGGSANYAVDSGMVNAYVIAVNAGIISLTQDGLAFRFKTANANTASATLNTIQIVRQNGDALQSGDIVIGMNDVVYNTTTSKFHLMSTSLLSVANNAAASAAAAAASAIASAGFATNSSDSAADAALSAVSAANSPSTNATSTTSMSISLAVKSFTIEIGKAFSLGQTVIIARTSSPSTQMSGVITSYTPASGAIEVTTSSITGSGTYTDWTISLSGTQGIQGATAAMARDVRTSDIALTASDIGKLIDITTGTIQTLASAVSVGAAWALTIKNSTANTITITPTGADLINGASSYLLESGHTLSLQCNGVTFTSALDSVRMSRLHVLSAAAATKYAVSSMVPMFEKPSTTINSLDVKKVLVTPSGFLSYFSGTSQYCETSPDGVTWTQRTIGAALTGAPWVLVTNGNNVAALTKINAVTTYVRNSSDGGITWSVDYVLASIGLEHVAYTNTGKCLASQSNQCKISTDNGVTWGAAQTIPHVPTGLGVVALGDTFVSTRTDSGTYYTSTTGLTGSWTSRTLPDSITANKIWEDGAGGLVVVSTTTSKNLWYTVDGITWTDLGFSQDSIKYGGLSAAASNSAAFVCPVRINSHWVLFNGTSGAGGAGAFIKYAGNTWTPMLVDCGNLANTDNTKKLVAVNGAGNIVVKAGGANNNVYTIDTTSTRSMGYFIN